MKERVTSLLRMQPPVLLDRGLLFLSGATVPSDGTDGYQPGCFFQDTTNGIVYVNEGSVTSCEFNAVTTGGLADVLTIGAFASLLQGSGIPISSSQTGAALVYSDDAGTNIATSCRGLLSRFLLTVDASGSSIRAAMGQLKLATGVDVTTGIYTAVQGYVELAGTHSVQTGATFSCFDASLEVTTALTVDSGGEACGLHVETTGAGSITNNGTCAGILVSNAASAPRWPIGLYITGGSAYAAIKVGVQDTGVDLTTTYPYAVEVHCEANADVVAGLTGHTAGFYVRYALETAQTSNTAHVGVFGKLRVKANLGEGDHAGVKGWVEISGSTILGGSSTTTTSAGTFAVIAASTLNLSTGHLNGIVVDCSVDDSATIGGTLAGIRIKKSSGCYAWPTGIQLESASCTTGINIACGTTPNTSRTNHALVIGGRSTAELTVTFTANTALHYEPIQTNFDMAGVAPTSESTVNVWQGGITHDTRDMANLRLKFTDLLTTVAFDCKDVYIHQAEIILSGTTTVSREVAVLGLVCNAGSGTITCGTYNGVNITMRGSGTPAHAAGLMIHTTSSAVVAYGLKIYGTPQPTIGLCMGDYANDNQGPTHLLFVPSGPGADVGPVVQSATGAGTAAEGSIKIKVGSSTKYLQYFTASS